MNKKIILDPLQDRMGEEGQVIKVWPDGTIDLQFEDGEIVYGVDPEDYELEVIKK
jgi:hypothetical protein